MKFSLERANHQAEKRVQVADVALPIFRVDFTTAGKVLLLSDLRHI